MRIKLLQVREATSQQISNAADVAALMREEAKADREAFWILHLNTHNDVIEKELVSLGCLDYAPVHPREVFKKAILNSAQSIITVHNHPSGNPEPSDNDDKVWKQLQDTGELLGIPVIDNLIVTPSGKFYSYKD